MSCSLWRWTERCDGQPCVGDCDLCSYHPEEENEDEFAKVEKDMRKIARMIGKELDNASSERVGKNSD